MQKSMVDDGCAPIDAEAIVAAFYPRGGLTRDLLLRHGELVGRKAFCILDQAPWLDVDHEFVYQAAMLHDIGIGQTRCPELGCTGTLAYVHHGVAGRCMLDGIGLSRHGLVCERHVGVGISADDVQRQRLDLPRRDMLPLSMAERLICYADKFYSKADNGRHEKTPDEIIAALARHGSAMAGRFLALQRLFSAPPDPADAHFIRQVTDGQFEGGHKFKDKAP